MSCPRLTACLVCPTLRTQMLDCARHTLRNSVDAEDLIQQVALEALVKSKRMGRIDNPESWLWQFYRLAHRDLARERRRRQKYFGVPLSEHVSSQDIERELIEKEERHRLQECLAQLTPRQQQVIRMLYVEDRNGKEIAAALGITYKAFRLAKETALSQLREQS